MLPLGWGEGGKERRGLRVFGAPGPSRIPQRATNCRNHACNLGDKPKPPQNPKP